mmetsp:Transcript_26539/g.64133  ORF Transcript_26539/g.64133 Transcript_26539/m.64133 type:complete len:176 (-) Transcript_26539:532-1059(-)
MYSVADVQRAASSDGAGPARWAISAPGFSTTTRIVVWNRRPVESPSAPDTSTSNVPFRTRVTLVTADGSPVRFAATEKRIGSDEDSMCTTVVLPAMSANAVRRTLVVAGGAVEGGRGGGEGGVGGGEDEEDEEDEDDEEDADADDGGGGGDASRSYCTRARARPRSSERVKFATR